MANKKPKLKKGDRLQCHSEADMIQFVNRLEWQGYTCDYYHDETGYWIEILDVKRKFR